MVGISITYLPTANTQIEKKTKLRNFNEHHTNFIKK